MKILITGGAGFIGSAVVRLAIAKGHSVVNLDALTYAANLENVRTVADAPGYAFVHASITDRGALAAAFAAHRPDAVMHLAAESHVDRSIDGPAAFVETNLVGTSVLLDAALAYWRTLGDDARARFRFHHVSTDEVYGTLGPSGQFTEESPYRPNSPYAATKAGSDMLARAWAQTYGLPVVLSNTSNNYGPYQFPEKLIPVVILKALAGEPIPVYGTGANVRDWLYVEDHADALLTILTRGTPGETYNVGANAEMTNLALVEALCARLDEALPTSPHRPHRQLIQFVADRPGHDLRYAIDGSKIARTLGWTPRVSLPEGLARTVAWYLENRAWWEAIKARTQVGARLGLAKD
ncbi:MAG: dTDP-glucose 4,6-dehydratase [Alphaproteobacteria bacterium]|nr:dTDP-glucose 4,6-dehydratase [Alphaproteobacteria bacterium]